MVVSTTNNRISYAANGSTTVFAYPFKIFANSDLVVKLRDSDGVETLLVLTTDYTVSGAGDAGGGNVTTVATYASGNTLVIRRSMPLTQLVDYVENDNFPAETHEGALDRAVMITQQLEEIVGRAIKFAETSSESDVPFPDPIASKFIRWNDDGDALELGDVVATGALTTPVSVANGGTAGSTKPGARTSLEVGKITFGVDASKAASPVQGEAYYSTDTDVFYICFTAGTWRSFKPFAKGADVASASALPLIDDGDYVDVTGTTTITSMNSMGIGKKITLHFDGALTLTHHATDLILPGGADIITAAGDEFTFIEYAAGDWRFIGGSKYIGWAKGADVASAAALPLIKDGRYFDVTGTTTITSMNSVGIGKSVLLHFDGALVLTHHATNLILPGSVNITTVAGDELEFTEYASGQWRLSGGNSISLGRITLTGDAPSPPVANTLYTNNIVKGWINFNGTGTIAINASVNVSSITDDGVGNYTVTWNTDFADVNYAAVPSTNLNHASVHTFAVGSVAVQTADDSHSSADITPITVIATGNQ